jgi:outer membrane receptor for ferric coprogen and ferric-rhodotorulic acid
MISTANIGDGYSRGVEFEFSGRLTSHLNAQFGYAYNDSTLQTASFQALSATVPSVPGGRLPNAPSQTASLSLDYRMAVGANWEINPGISAYYRGPMVTATTANRFPLGGFTTASATVGIDHGQWRGLLYVNSVTNKLGLNSAPNTDTWGQGAAALINRPRTAGFVLTYRLGKE